ncbi:hypothetical protein IQ07DRAFT_587541 [Pyrenochaeta sp. DS3sAY3a]|nr:hypothetical protein IQ07DRAFT_587541 [Pyrenochaeta sp. DS3sAY3a]
MQSRVTPFGYSSESCGYCKDAPNGSRRPNSRASYYFSSKSLTVDVYQNLVDRGWRRYVLPICGYTRTCVTLPSPR